MNGKIYPPYGPESTPIITPRALKQKYPQKISQFQFIKRSRQQIIDILEGRDSRLLLIMGPCSIHHLLSAREYAQRFRKLSKEVEKEALLVMRVYFEKPRTVLGWKGIMYDPHLDGSNDMHTGLYWTRQLLLSLAEMKVPAGSEILDPQSTQYFGDLLSWCCIGARTSSSQIHRQMASGLSIPVAFKNNTDGNIEIAIHGILSAQKPHAHIALNEAGCSAVFHTKGNPYTHLVLRGSDTKPNYDRQSIKEALKLLKSDNLSLRLLVDCSHGNSGRQHEKQIDVFCSIMEQVKEGNRSIRGILLESFLDSGNQSLTPPIKPTVSITDSCLGWEKTEWLIREQVCHLNHKNKRFCEFAVS